MSKKPRLKINPTIQGGIVVTVKVGEVQLPLRNPIPISNFPDFIDKLEAITEYIDFEGKTGWTDDEIYDFFDSYLTIGAIRFFEILASEGQWVQRTYILDELKMEGRTLAGTLSSPGQHFSKYGKDPIYEKEWKKDEKGDWNLYYQLKPEYLDLVRKWFE
ncbi:MAG: hypothetical protein ACFFDT_09675 [Candidatus Hodarchaeota archaeon]